MDHAKMMSVITHHALAMHLLLITLATVSKELMSTTIQIFMETFSMTCHVYCRRHRQRRRQRHQSPLLHRRQRQQLLLLDAVFSIILEKNENSTMRLAATKRHNPAAKITVVFSLVLEIVVQQTTQWLFLDRHVVKLRNRVTICYTGLEPLLLVVTHVHEQRRLHQLQQRQRGRPPPRRKLPQLRRPKQPRHLLRRQPPACSVVCATHSRLFHALDKHNVLSIQQMVHVL